MQTLSHECKRSPSATLLDPTILLLAVGQSFRKLDPRLMARNPVMFCVEVVATMTTLLFLRDLVTGSPAGHAGFAVQIIVCLFFTLLYAILAEAVALGRGKAQAAML